MTRLGVGILFLCIALFPLTSWAAEGDLVDLFMLSAYSGGLHPVTGINSSILLDHMSLEVLVEEPSRCRISCDYSIRNPEGGYVTEKFFLPLSVSLASVSSIKDYYCWLFGGMDLQLNHSYLSTSVTLGDTILEFDQGDEDPMLDEFLMQYRFWNLSRGLYGGRSFFIPLSFNVTMPPRSTANLSTTYVQPYLLYPEAGLETNATISNITSLRGLFAYLGASIGLWANTTSIDSAITVRSDLFHSSEEDFAQRGGWYVSEKSMDDWNPITQPTMAFAWTAWETSNESRELPDMYRRSFERLLNQSIPTDIPWETNIPGELGFAGSSVSLEGSRLIIEANITGGEGHCLVPVLQYETRSRYGGGGGGPPPRSREDGSFRWEQQVWSETSSFSYQICIWNNDAWILSPIQFHSYPDLEVMKPNLDVKMWVEDRREGDMMPPVVYWLPPNMTDPQCVYRYMGRGLPGSASGSMEEIGGGIYRYSFEMGGSSEMGPYYERFQDGVVFTYVLAWDQDEKLRRSPVFTFSFGDLIPHTIDAEYSKPSSGPVPIGEFQGSLFVCVLTLVIHIIRKHASRTIGVE